MGLDSLGVKRDDYQRFAERLETHGLLDRKGAKSVAKFLTQSDRRCSEWLATGAPPSEARGTQSRSASPVPPGFATPPPAPARRQPLDLDGLLSLSPSTESSDSEGSPSPDGSPQPAQRLAQTPPSEKLIPPGRLRDALSVHVQAVRSEGAPPPPGAALASSTGLAAAVRRWLPWSGAAGGGGFSAWAGDGERLSLGEKRAPSGILNLSAADRDFLRLRVTFHVRDARTGRAWVLERPLGALAALRERLVALRPSLEGVRFPAVSSAPPAGAGALRQLAAVLEGWLQRALGLVYYAPGHVSNLRVQQELQAFLRVAPRLPQLEAREADMDAAQRLRAAVEANVHRALGVPYVLRRLAAFRSHVVEEALRRGDLSWALAKLGTVLDVLEDALLATVGAAMAPAALAHLRGASRDAKAPPPAEEEDEARRVVAEGVRRAVEAAVFRPVHGALLREGLMGALCAEDEALSAAQAPPREPQEPPQPRWAGWLAGSPRGRGGAAEGAERLHAEVRILARLRDEELLPCEQHAVLLEAAHQVTATHRARCPGAEPLGTDGLLPAFHGALAQARIPHLCRLSATLRGICTRSRANGEQGFILTTLEAAVEALKGA